jgi:hypothetical protein
VTLSIPKLPVQYLVIVLACNIEMALVDTQFRRIESYGGWGRETRKGAGREKVRRLVMLKLLPPWIQELSFQCGLLELDNYLNISITIY